MFASDTQCGRKGLLLVPAAFSTAWRFACGSDGRAGVHAAVGMG